MLDNSATFVHPFSHAYSHAEQSGNDALLLGAIEEAGHSIRPASHAYRDVDEVATARPDASVPTGVAKRELWDRPTGSEHPHGAVPTPQTVGCRIFGAQHVDVCTMRHLELLESTERLPVVRDKERYAR